MIAKLCAVCGADLAHRKRADHRYCGVRCRVRAHRLRVAAGIREARRRRRADRDARAQTSRRQVTEQTITELRERLRQEQEANEKLAERVERLRHQLARWQQQRGLPVTVPPLPLGADVQMMATHAAFQARWNYQQSPPSERKTRVWWLHRYYQLDSQSETALRRAIDERIAKMKTQMRE